MNEGESVGENRQHLRRRGFINILLSGTTGTLAGCLGDSGDSESSERTATETTANDSGSGESITFTHIDTFEDAAETFQSEFTAGREELTVELDTTPGESAATRTYLAEAFEEGSQAIDIAMMDVIWPAEFVANDWIVPLDGVGSLTDALLDAPVENVTIDGQVYGLPLYTDANVFYYRSDKLDEYGFNPPKTYSEVIEQAQTILEADDEITKGYIWQGGTNEGLTIMWLNWLWGFGGSVQQDEDLVVNTQEGVDALAHAVNLIHEHGITPTEIAVSGTQGNRETFQRGETLFMRNWPFAAGLYEDDTPVTGRFDLTTLPKASDHQDAENSCLGGWSLVINHASENKAGAREFAQYMASVPVQERLAMEFSRLPVREELYTNEYYEQEPALETFAESLQEAKSRPRTPQYSRFSEIVYRNCNQALVQEKTPQEALDDAQQEIDANIN
jgi:multiple sugar transport system substrate-binding protein